MGEGWGGDNLVRKKMEESKPWKVEGKMKRNYRLYLLNRKTRLKKESAYTHTQVSVMRLCWINHFSRNFSAAHHQRATLQSSPACQKYVILNFQSDQGDEDHHHPDDETVFIDFCVFIFKTSKTDFCLFFHPSDYFFLQQVEETVDEKPTERVQNPRTGTNTVLGWKRMKKRKNWKVENERGTWSSVSMATALLVGCWCRSLGRGEVSGASVWTLVRTCVDF